MPTKFRYIPISLSLLHLNPSAICESNMTKAVVLVPRVSVSRFLCSALDAVGIDSYRVDSKEAVNLGFLLPYFSNGCKDASKSKDKSQLQMLRVLLQRLWNRPASSYMAAPTLGKDIATMLMCAFVRMRDWAYFDLVIVKNRGVYNSDTFFSWINKVTAGIDRVITFSEVEEPLGRALLAIPTLWDSLNAAKDILPVEQDAAGANTTADVPDKALREEWARTMTEKLLDGLSTKVVDEVGSKGLGYHDGQIIVSHCLPYYDLDHVETRYAISLYHL